MDHTDAANELQALLDTLKVTLAEQAGMPPPTNASQPQLQAYDLEGLADHRALRRFLLMV